MIKIKRLAGVVFTALLLGALSAPAKASSISIMDSASSWNLDYLLSGQTSVDIKSNVKIETQSYNLAEIILKFTVSNLTSATFQSAIRSIGFDVAPNSDVSFSGSGDVFNRIATNTTFPDYKKIDICVFAGNNNCAGGPIDNGLQSGETDSFLLKFVGNYTNGLVLSQLPTRWQTAEGSYNFSPGSVVSLSEPSTITLVLTGLLLMIAVLHRRRLVQAVARVRSPLRGPSAHARPLCGQA